MTFNTHMTSEITLYPVSTFEAVNSKEPDGLLPLGEILDKIQSGFWKELVLPCRENKELKTLLPVFTPTGTFRSRGIACHERTSYFWFRLRLRLSPFG